MSCPTCGLDYEKLYNAALSAYQALEGAPGFVRPDVAIEELATIIEHIAQFNDITPFNPID